MTRQTPIPLLRYLAPNTLVARCSICNELIMGHEMCRTREEAYGCPQRGEIDGLVEIPLNALASSIGANVRNLDA
jgi:hypothetical protein